MMKTLYAQYVKERENLETIETDLYFATYKIVGNEIHLKDLFVHPNFRQDRLARNVANMISEIGKNKGCRYLITSVCPKANGADLSLKVIQSYGMKLLRSNDNLIYFIKEI